MKHFFLKSTLALLLLVLGVGQASAQSVTFTHNRYRGAQSTSNSKWRRYDALNKTTDSNWITNTGYSWVKNGSITSSEKMVIQRYNSSGMAGELFDWFTIAYTAPSYSKVTYTLTIKVAAEHYQATLNSVRAAYFDYGTNYSYWSSWVKDPIDWYDFRTADESSDSPNQTVQGETVAAFATQGTKADIYSSKNITVVVDNNAGSGNTTSYRYGGFSSSKSYTLLGLSNYENTGRLWLKQTSSTTYYKHVTFNANGGTGTMNKQVVADGANLTANAFKREGFTFAGWSTTPSGAVAYGDKAWIVANSGSKGPVTLYAQWTAQPITAKFDYTYRTSDVAGGAETYVHMGSNNESAAITDKVRVNLRNASGTVLVSKVLTAPAANTPTGTPNSSINTHKTAAITLNVVQSGTEKLSGANCTVVLGNNYTNYRSIDFEVLTNASTQNSQTVASHWVSTKQSATSYIFKYEGHESKNMFNLTWRVNLTNLSMYPTDIFVKPMRKGTHTDNGGSTTLEQIPAMEGIDGIECEFAGYIDGDKTKGAYYTGEYKVLKTCAHGNNYNYQIGLTGFILDGITYYLAEKEGDIPSDMISSAFATPTSANIIFDRTKEQIPVLILSPNVANNETLADSLKATVSGRANYKLYVDNDANVDAEGKRTVNLAQFEAVRPGYDFVCWKDAYDQTATYAKDGNYQFNMGTKATTTLLAQWERTNAPVIIGDDMIENENNFIYKVKVWDELDDIQSVEYIYTDTDEKPADVQGWAAMTAERDSIYSVTIPLLNDHHGEYLWAKASNADKDSIIDLGEIRSIFRLTANANPNSHVSEQIQNGHTETQNIDGKDTTVFIVDGTSDVHYYDYYSTFFYSNRNFIVSNATVYTAKLNGNQLDLTEFVPSEEHDQLEIPANTAVILRKNLATDGVIELHEYNANDKNVVSVDNDNNDLKGTDGEKTISNTDINYYYILSYAQDGLGFYHPYNTTLAAHKAYIDLTGSSVAPRAFIFNFGNGNDPIATAIENTEAETLLNGPVYNIYGQMVAPSLDKAENLVNGIYVVNGKKVVINK